MLAVALPFIPQILVISQILLVLNWILEGRLSQKIKLIYQRKSILFFLLIYLVHIIWLIKTDNFQPAFTDLFMKLPLLIIPIVLGTSEPLSKSRIKQILKYFIISVVFSTLISTAILFGIIPFKFNDIRQISVFISHIRLSLLIVISILTLFHWLISEGRSFTKRHFLYILLCFWLFLFLILLRSLTGLVVLCISSFLLILIYLKSVNNQFFKIGLIMAMYAIPVFVIGYLVSAINKFYSNDTINFKNLDSYTINKNQYFNDTLYDEMENGHYVRIYICEKELEREWNKRSKFKYSGFDLKNQPLRYALMRYMTSKGLRKDSLGLSKMKAIDIENVENGYTNYIQENKWSLYPRIYEVLWEIETYRKGLSSSGHSVTQRLVYYNIAFDFIKKYPLLGIGTGDLKISFKQYYETHKTGLEKPFQRDTHNQFLRFLVLFGIFGFIIIMFAFIIAPVLEKTWTSYYFVMIFIVLFLSFINEDTLETQVGVTFAAFFYSLFLWGMDHKSLVDYNE